jgi:hypothetical protein
MMMKTRKKDDGAENSEMNRNAAERPALRCRFGVTLGGSRKTGAQ